MPRKKGGLERMEQEKKKRQSGQNGRDSVRVEERAEMVLRQRARPDDRSAQRPVSHRRSNAREGVTGYCVC